MSKVDLDKLMSHQSEIEVLFNDAQKVLGQNIFGLLGQAAGLPSVGGTPGMIASPPTFLGEILFRGIGSIIRTKIEEETKTRLEAYYRELISKQNMITREKDKTIAELEKAVSELNEENETRKEEIRALKAKRDELTAILDRIISMRKTVEV